MVFRMLLSAGPRASAIVAGIALAAGLASPAPARAEGAWPERPLRVVVPFPPGGPSDIVLRGASASMEAALKQPLVVENKPGAAGNVGAVEVARAAPDGYTWLWSTDTLLTVNPHVYPKLPFRPDDLVPVMRASEFSQTLVCNPAAGVRTVADLVKKAKAESVNYASGGPGSPGHLSTELLKSMTGIEMTHVAYKGPAPAMQDVMAGQVACGFLAGPTVLPQVRAGKLVAVAVSGSKRSALLPEVPTVAQSGVAGFDATFSLVLYAPRGTPRAIVDRMHAALAAALREPALIERLRLTDQEAVSDSPEASVARITADSRKWGEVARRIGLRVD